MELPYRAVSPSNSSNPRGRSKLRDPEQLKASPGKPSSPQYAQPPKPSDVTPAKRKLSPGSSPLHYASSSSVYPPVEESHNNKCQRKILQRLTYHKTLSQEVPPNSKEIDYTAIPINDRETTPNSSRSNTPLPNHTTR